MQLNNNSKLCTTMLVHVYIPNMDIYDMEIWIYLHMPKGCRDIFIR